VYHLIVALILLPFADQIVRLLYGPVVKPAQSDKATDVAISD
jgi:hypothetical protein